MLTDGCRSSSGNPKCSISGLEKSEKVERSSFMVSRCQQLRSLKERQRFLSLSLVPVCFRRWESPICCSACSMLEDTPQQSILVPQEQWSAWSILKPPQIAEMLLGLRVGLGLSNCP